VTPQRWLDSRGFRVKGEQPVGATDYIIQAGVFRVRVRLPLEGYESAPALWFGFTAGGPLVERPSYMKYRDVWKAVEDAVILGRILRGH
jgi:hypothetical protein